MKRVALTHCGLPHQVECCGHMRRGLERHGVEVIDRPGPGDPVITWGWRQARPWRERGHDVLVMERGYVGPRPDWTACGWNGLNGRALFPQPVDKGERWYQNFRHLMKPARADGEYVLIMGQVAGDAAVRGVDINGWYHKAAARVSCYGKPVLFRQHPRERSGVTPSGIPVLHGSLEEALERAALVVTWNSGSGVDAVLAGVPVIAEDEGSMVWGLSGQPVPDRAPWAARMAWCQWSAGELASGLAWEYLREVDACRRIGHTG